MVLKNGMVVYSVMGDPNASIPTPEPILHRPMYASFGKALQRNSITFVSKIAYDLGVHKNLGLEKIVLPVSGIRNITKKDMKHNSETPEITVDPQTYDVRVNGELITCEPAESLPLTQRYFLF